MAKRLRDPLAVAPAEKPRLGQARPRHAPFRASDCSRAGQIAISTSMPDPLSDACRPEMFVRHEAVKLVLEGPRLTAAGPG